MKKWVLMMVLVAVGVGATGAWADDQPAKSTTVGGGVPNPWRSPYKTALTQAPKPLAP